MRRILLNPKIDFVFKKIFGSADHPDILISFLNAVLKPQNPITSVEIKNSDLEKEYIEDKFSRLDVKALTSNREIINIEKDNIIYNYVNTEKSTINDYLRENGGIRVYRDNVRVYDYGERDNDWLGIDLKRVHRVGGNISNNIILGSVRLDRKYSIGLKEKTNREGFIEDEAYNYAITQQALLP